MLVEREEDGRLTGRARAGQLVHFNRLARSVVPGDLVEITVDQVTPWSLQGRLADERSLAVV